MTKKNEDFVAAQEIDAILGEGATDELRAKAKTIFEAAVAVEVKAQVETQMEAVNAKIDEMVAEKLAEKLGEIEENVDRYVSYVAEEWLTENEMAIESALRVERADAIVEGLLNLLGEHNLEVPEGSENVVEALVSKNDELVGKLNESLKRGMKLEEALANEEKKDLIDAAVAGLTDVQAIKVRKLAENVKHKDVEDFKAKLAILKETIKPEAAPAKVDATQDDLPIIDSTVKPLTEEQKVVARAKDYM